VTLYDPLKYYGMVDSPQKKTIGVIGIGGLGTMGIKLAKAMGHKVVAISTNPNKEQQAKDKGADVFVVSTSAESMKSGEGLCDLILNTASSPHEANLYLGLLKNRSTIVQLGVLAEPHALNCLPLICGRKAIAGSLIGGIQATEECIEFCAKHGIYPDIQVIEADKITWAFEQLLTTNKDGVRYVIDIQKSKQNKDFMPKK
jgi:D-arabinose 1-dehydrogenase-like Zn-dependent alcohol dehydrogenase